MLRRTVVVISMICWAATSLMSQSTLKEFDKLIFLYIDEKYEKCVKKGIKYTEDKETRRDPIPYLYVSMSYFEISKRPALVEDHPNAFKYALKYAYKYRKKDEEGIYTEKYNGFLTALKDSANRLAQYYLKIEEERKASTVYKYTSRFATDDPLIKLWYGIALIKARNIGEGERYMTMAMEEIDEDYMPDEVMLWVATPAMEEYAAYYDSKGDYAKKRFGEKMAAKFKEYTPEAIAERKKMEAKKDEPKREVKTFETSEEQVEGQKKKIIGTTDKAKSAKSELERIEEEQQSTKKKPKTFTSDEDDEDDDDW